MPQLGLVVTATAWPCLFAFALSLALVPACRSLAVRLGCVTQPRQDRWHRRPVPLLGGLAIGLTLLIGLLVFGITARMAFLAGGSAVILVTGLIDDVVSLKPFTKLVIEIAVASAFLFLGFRLNWTTSPTLDTMLTLMWVVGMTNAFNLLDNMDGLCAGIALIVGAGLVVGLIPVKADTDAYFQARYLAVLLGATAGFLVYNINPASIFMGDSGSLLLGLNFAALTLGRATAAAANSTPLSIIAAIAAPVLMLLIPIFDTSLVAASRIVSGRAPSEGGLDHSSHRLVAMGLSERAAVAVLWLLAATGGLLSLGINYFNLSWSAPVVLLFLVAVVIFAAYLARVRVYEPTDAPTLDPQKLTPILTGFMYKRRVAEVLLDLCLVPIAYYAAYRLRFEGPEDFTLNFPAFYRSLPLVLATQMTALLIVGIYRGVWRYFGLVDAIAVAKGVLFGAISAQLLLLYIFRFQGYSRTVFAIYGIILFIILMASRASFQLIGELLHRNRDAATRVIVYGAGDGGSLAVRELLKAQGERYRILGFIDDDTAKHRIRVRGFPVLGGYDSLVSLVLGDVVDTVVISARIMSVDRLRDLEVLCSEHGVSLARFHVGLEYIVAGEGTSMESVSAGSLFRKTQGSAF